MTTALETPVLAAVPPRRIAPPARELPVGSVLNAERRDEALTLWRQLEARLVQGSPAAGIPLAVSSRWTTAWLQHYGDVVPHEYLLLRDTAGPVGITLLTRGLGPGLGPFREQSRHLGTAGEPHGESVCVEHNHLLVAPEHRRSLQELIVSHVLHDKSWESLRLDGFTEPEANSLFEELPGFDVRYRDAPYYNLQAAREAGGDPLDRLGRSTRQNTRRLLRKSGEIDIQWATTADEARDIFAELVTLHQARWKAVGQPGAFHSRRFLSFQRTLLEQSFASPENQRQVVLFRARQQSQTIGCLLLLIDGRRLLDYLSGFADFNVVTSPGVVTHVLCLQEALRRGYDEYDFLVGEKRHKDNLSTDVNRLVWAVWSRPTLRSRTIGMLRSVKRQWRELRLRNAPTPAADPGA